MNTELVHTGTNALALVNTQLEEIMKRAKDLGIPIKEFWQASGGLRRKGVSFFVVLKGDDLEHKVPLRVSDPVEFLHYRHCPKEQLESWNGNPVYQITIRTCRYVEELRRKLVQCLKTAWNRITRKSKADGCTARLRVNSPIINPSGIAFA